MGSPKKKVKMMIISEAESDNSENEFKTTNMNKAVALNKRAAKTRDVQYEKMNEFMDGKQKVNDDNWDQLTLELNAFGPPCHTKPQWKKVWNDFQRNNMNKVPSRTHTSSSQEDLLHKGDSRVPSESTPLEKDEINYSNEKSEIVKRLDLIVEQQIRHNDLFESLVNLIKDNFLVVNLP